MSSEAALAISLARGPLIGTFLGLVLYGVTCMQAIFYFRTYEHDRRELKIIVALLVVFETTHAAMTMWVMDDYLIVQYANIPALETATWSSTSTYILGLLIDFYVYTYFTWRIWLFTKNLCIIALMFVLSISRTAISIILCILSVVGPSWRNYLNSSKALFIVGNTLFIVGDTLSAGTMAYHLNKLKCHAHAIPPNKPRRINLLLNRLLVFAVSTGALMLLMDVMALILTLAQPQSLAFVSAIIVQTRLYANSLLASLNIRNAASRAYDNAPSTQVELPITSLHFAPPSDLTIVSEEDDSPGHAYEGGKL